MEENKRNLYIEDSDDIPELEEILKDIADMKSDDSINHVDKTLNSESLKEHEEGEIITPVKKTKKVSKKNSISVIDKKFMNKQTHSFYFPKELIVDMKSFCVIKKISISSFISMLPNENNIFSNLVSIANDSYANSNLIRINVVIDYDTWLFFKLRSIESFTTISKVVGQYVYTYLKLNNYGK